MTCEDDEKIADIKKFTGKSVRLLVWNLSFLSKISIFVELIYKFFEIPLLLVSCIM